MSTKTKLGQLKRVDLRKAWSREDTEFTPWLAEPENLALLGEAIGMQLEPEDQEVSVGPFRADILCRDLTNDRYVVIENQLEGTDHSHLGQILTYVAGLDATTSVWVAKSFKDEHRAALDFLNSVTDDEHAFFGVEVQLWQIDASSFAPRFDVVSKPNDWTRTAKQAKEARELTGVRKHHLEYWTALRALLEREDSRVKPQKPHPQHWASYAIGRSYFHLNAISNTRDKRLGVQLCLTGPDAKAHFHALKELYEAEPFEALGKDLEWN